MRERTSEWEILITKLAPLAQASKIGTVARPSSTEACQRGSGRPLNVAVASVYLTDYHIVCVRI